MLRHFALLLLVLGPAAAAAAEVELALSSGRTVRGELVADTGTGLTLRMRSPVRGGTKEIEVAYQRGDILRRKDLPTPEQQYAERKAATAETVPELCTLAQWCYENCLRTQAHDHALQVLAADAENAWAKRILDNCGYVLADGKWQDENEYMKAKGLVRVDGQMVPAAIAEARKVLARAVSARSSQARKVAELRKQASERPKSAAPTDPKALAAAAEKGKKELAAAEKQLEDFRAEPAAKGADAADKRKARLDELTKRVSEIQEQQREQKKAGEDAKRAADRAERAKASLAEAEAALAKAEAEVKTAAAALPADDPAAVAALAGLQAAEETKAADKPSGEDKQPAADKPVERKLRRSQGAGAD